MLRTDGRRNSIMSCSKLLSSTQYVEKSAVNLCPLIAMAVVGRVVLCFMPMHQHSSQARPRHAGTHRWQVFLAVWLCLPRLLAGPSYLHAMSHIP